MRKTRPWIRVTIEGKTGYVAGPNTKSLIEQCGGRPMWIGRRKAWATRASTATDVLALAELDGYAISYAAGGDDQ